MLILPAPNGLVGEGYASCGETQLKQLVLLHVKEGAYPTAGAHMHFFVLRQRQQLFKLIFWANSCESHSSKRTSPPDSLMRLNR